METKKLTWGAFGDVNNCYLLFHKIKVCFNKKLS